MEKSSGQLHGKLPKKVGNVRLGGLIGSGNIGSVYRGYHETLAIDVAVKLLHNKTELTQGDVDRFIDEARIAARINHANITRIYDCGLENDICYLIMEFVDGSNCEELVQRNGRLNETAALKIVHAVVLGLAEAARFGMLHHDIKPANILVSRNGTVKLGDMGAAIMIGRHGTLFGESENFYMTPEFAAPERILDNTETDIRSDIYSVGATLYYLLTANTVRKGLDPGTPLEKIAWQPITPVRTHAPEISDACESFVKRLLMTDPDKRYQSYTEILNALSEITGSVSPSLPDIIIRSPDQLLKTFKSAASFWYQNIEHLSKAGGIVAGISFLAAILSWSLFGHILHLGSTVIIAANIILQSLISGPLILGLFVFVMNIFNKPGQKPALSNLLKGFNKRKWPASTVTILCCESISLLARTIFTGPFFFLFMLVDIVVKGTGCYAFLLLATGQATFSNLAAETGRISKKDYTGLLAVGLAFWTVEYLTAACLHPLVYIVTLAAVLPFFSTLMFYLNQGKCHAYRP